MDSVTRGISGDIAALVLGVQAAQIPRSDIIIHDPFEGGDNDTRTAGSEIFTEKDIRSRKPLDVVNSVGSQPFAF